ncbi:MAG: family 16 glycosylhydrolase [Bacteroidota bacterium]|nr:family 16 glycosylhydrolase [Bacteroidota bacterium]
MFKSFSLIICFTFVITIPGVLLLSCQKESYPEFTPDFSYEVSEDDPNTVRFVNTTTSEHGFMQWDFGNGEQTNRQPANRLTYSMFYPMKGEYPVTLTIWGESGNEDDKKSVTKTVTIQYSAPDPDFEYEIISGSPNLLKLTDVSTGDYNSVTWRYSGREYSGVPGEVRVLYLAMGGTYDIEFEIRRDEISKTISKKITIQADDPDYLDHYQLVWSDEFDGDEINPSEWAHETGASGWGNDELQNYTDGQNTSVSGGTLKITAEKTGTGQNVGDYTSSRINGTESFIYGRFEVRAKMPEYKGPGLWPALWMLGRSIQEGTSWPLCGEIDIMEYVSWKPDYVSSAIHTQSNNHAQGTAISSGHISLPTVEEEFHVYGLIWTYTYLKFYIDGVDNIILTYNKPGTHDDDNWPFYKPFYFLFNIAVGGTYGGVEGVDDSIFPAVMEIDYARVYQLN